MPEPPGRRPRREITVRRVQRPIDGNMPIVHLEADPPAPKSWIVSVDGLVSVPLGVTLDEIRRMGPQERVWDFHCVWGWSRPQCRWEGIPAAALLDRARPRPEATHVVARCITGPYASCLTLVEARSSLVAWRLDGRDLAPEHGGPLRLVPPPRKWAYKGVKWFGGFSVRDKFAPGFWEEMVGNPSGDVPDEMLDLRFE